MLDKLIVKKRKVYMDWPVNCANCGKETLVNDEPGDKCVWCGESPYKKEVNLMLPEERAKYEGMNKYARSKWLANRMEEIIADIRSMPKKKVLEKWPFGQSTLYKLKKLYAPELIGKPTSKPKKRKDKKPPLTVKEDSGLNEHESYLILLGYQMATREFLNVREN